ncbi:MAG: hypothetical protein GYA50_06965 [Eubacteriaceae bacterium]|nr:hypothetical protein [Eubacteriaceae bacterium]
MILVFGHNFSYTDIDSIVSSIALAYILKAEGKDAKPVIINKNAVQDSEKNIISKIGGLEIPEFVSKDMVSDNEIAIVDHNDPDESYGAIGINKTPVFCIDHHSDTGIKADVKIIKKVGAAATLVAKLAKDKSIKLTDSVAEALVFGILSDTKGFRSKKTTQDDKDMVEYLYSAYHILKSVEEIVAIVIVDTDINNMTIGEILNNDLKEYNNDLIGIASMEVTDDDYLARIDEIKKEGWNTKYELYIFMLFKFHKNETSVYYFDKKYKCFPDIKNYKSIISRGQDIVPEIFEKISKP